MQRIYEFEIEDTNGDLKDSVEVRATNQTEALNKVMEFTLESNEMFDASDKVRPTPKWVSSFYVS